MRPSSSFRGILGFLCLLPLSGAGCAHILPRQESTLTEGGPTNSADGATGLVRAFVDAYEASYEASVLCRRPEGDAGSCTPSTEESRRAAAIEFLDTGLTLAHFRCSEFMTALGKKQQQFDLAQGATVVASTATTGAMGLTGVDPKTIGLVAAAFGTLLAGGEVYQQVALFNPDTRAVSILVSKAMDAHGQAAREQSEGGDYDYTDAMRAVLDAQTLCQVESVKALVDKAIRDSDLEATPTTHRDALPGKFEEKTKTETTTVTKTETTVTGGGGGQSEAEVGNARAVETLESETAANEPPQPRRGETKRGGFDIRIR